MPEFYSPLTIRALSILISSWMALRGYRRKSLSKSGAVAAFIVGLSTFSCGPWFALILLTFYLSGSFVTRIGSDLKRRIDGEYKTGGERTASQVFSNAGFQMILAPLHYSISEYSLKVTLDFVTGPVERYTTIIVYMYASSFACCIGDTFASEIGILSRDDPLLVTNLQRVPKGTNGAISALGTFASILGGSLLAAVSSLYLIFVEGSSVLMATQLGVVMVISSVVGMLIDSFLGATLQATYLDKKNGMIYNETSANKTRINGLPLLTNNQVNLISTILTSLIAALSALFIM